MTATFAKDMEERVNAKVAAARPILSRILPRDEAMAIPDLIRAKINLLPAGITEVCVVEAPPPCLGPFSAKLAPLERPPRRLKHHRYRRF